jgi:hypothetical protein
MPLQLYKIASSELTATASTVTFSSIPQGYTDLKIVMSMRGDAASTYNDTYIQFNNDSAANYSMRRIYGTGSGAASDSLSGGTTFGRVGSSVGSTATASTFSNVEVHIPNYTSSRAKSFSSDGVTENNGVGAFATLYASLWSGTAAITSITILGLSTTFVAGTTFTLYGIL